MLSGDILFARHSTSDGPLSRSGLNEMDTFQRKQLGPGDRQNMRHSSHEAGSHSARVSNPKSGSFVPTDDADAWMRAEDASAYVGLSTSTLAKRRVTGDGPEYVKIGRNVIYRKSVLDSWMLSQRRTSTSQS
jgi:predicted DNA-binding transcriptional regulator AlpA